MIGSLLIIIKKLISKQIIQRIPKSNILAKPTRNHEQTFQMTTFHSTPRIIQVRPIDKNYAGDSSLSHPQPKNDQEESTQTSTSQVTPQIVPAEPGVLSLLCQN